MFIFFHEQENVISSTVLNKYMEEIVLLKVEHRTKNKKKYNDQLLLPIS